VITRLTSRVGARAGRRAALLAAGALTFGIGGCGKQSTLDPHSPQSHDIRTLWWWMFAVAGIVFLGAIAMLVYGWFRRGKRGLPFFGESVRAENTLVVIFGIAIPVVILVGLFFVSDVYVLGKTDAPNPSSTKLTVEVTGHQWWWEVRYPGTTAVTADEIHIPAQTEVNVVGTTADVIHSFWVPQLNRKIDLIPGRQNWVGLYADSPGVYRGQCAEFCGLQHSHMSFYVIADPPEVFRTWLANMSADAPAPTGAPEQAGQTQFMSDQCASCHTIRGTPAQGGIGPDLTHLASRTTIAALTLPNDATHLQEWIRDPQHFKPGNKMPGLNLSEAQIASIATYLRSLR
jgi:cytochrome c oxidase subunit II